MKKLTSLKLKSCSFAVTNLIVFLAVFKVIFMAVMILKNNVNLIFLLLKGASGTNKVSKSQNWNYVNLKFKHKNKQIKQINKQGSRT